MGQRKLPVAHGKGLVLVVTKPNDGLRFSLQRLPIKVGGSIQNPELARGEFDLILRDALRLKTEYLSIADRLQADLPELNSALNDPSVQKGRGELPRRLIEQPRRERSAPSTPSPIPASSAATSFGTSRTSCTRSV